VLDKTDWVADPTKSVGVVVLDTGRGKDDATWNDLVINETVLLIAKIGPVKLVDQKFTTYPLQLNYSKLRGEQDDDKDNWCQTWSWLFSMLVLYPKYVNEFHQTLLSLAIARKHQTVTRTILNSDVVSKLHATVVGDIVGNYNWVVAYLNLVSEIGHRNPVYLNIWLYVAIRVTIPYLNKYLHQSPQDILRGETEQISNWNLHDASPVSSQSPEDNHNFSRLREVFTPDNLPGLRLDTLYYSNVIPDPDINHVS
jgi:hypothetical protein